MDDAALDAILEKLLVRKMVEARKVQPNAVMCRECKPTRMNG